jgi:hypothetical protein
MRGTLILVAVILAIPLLLLALRAVFAWRYRRMLRSGMSRSIGIAADLAYSPATPLDVDRPPLTISRVHASAVRLHSSDARALNRDAKAMTRRVRLAFTAAALIYSAIASSTLAAAFLPTIPLDARVVGVYLSQACIPFIVASVLHLGPLRLAAMVGAYLAIGLAITLTVVSPGRAMALIPAEAELFLILPAIGLVLLVIRRLRPLLIVLVAVLLYVATMFAIAMFIAETAPIDVGQVRPWMWPLAVLTFIASVAIVGWLLGRPSVRVPVIVLASLAVIGLIIELAWSPAFPIGGILFAVPGTALQIFLVWMVFRLAIRLQDLRILSAQVLQSHIAFGFLSLYWALVLFVGTGLFSFQIWPAIAIVAAFCSYVLAVHVLLYLTWKQRTTRPGMRLLFLRAFGSTKGRERLLNALEDTWRRVGRIDLIAGTDLGVHTLGSRMIEAFIVRRADAQFLRTQQDVTDRLERLRSELEGDSRFPVNEIYCYTDTWQSAVSQLARKADAVLMDLREFSRRNRGCVFELTELVRRVPLRRVVLLADRTTDMTAVEEVAHAGWAGFSAGSPNANEPRPELKILDCDGRPRRNEHALFALLLEATAAAERDPAQGADPVPA